MLAYIIRRFLLAIVTVWAITVLSFVIIQLPPGDFVSIYINSLQSSGSQVSFGQAEAMRAQYGLDQPMYIQYAKWMGMMLQGDFGMALAWNKPVKEIIGDRLVLTMVVSIAAIMLTWMIALPIGIYSAVRQYSLGDYALHLHRLHRHRHTQLHVGPHPDVRWFQVLQHEYRRPLLPGVRERALEPGEGRRSGASI